MPRASRSLFVDVPHANKIYTALHDYICGIRMIYDQRTANSPTIARMYAVIGYSLAKLDKS
jgi:hypothetical protein